MNLALVEYILILLLVLLRKISLSFRQLFSEFGKYGSERIDEST